MSDLLIHEDPADYRIELKIRNNRILHYMNQMGYRTASSLSKAIGVAPGTIGGLINLKKPALNKFGEWKTSALKIAEALCCEPDDLWTDAQRNAALETNSASVELAEAEVSGLLCGFDPDIELLASAQSDVINEIITKLPPREEKIVRMRFGLAPYHKKYTLKEVGNIMGINGAWVRQIEERAIGRLSRDGELRDLVKDEHRSRGYWDRGRKFSLHTHKKGFGL